MKKIYIIFIGLIVMMGLFHLEASCDAASLTKFVSYGKPTFIYLDTKEVKFNFDDDGEDIKFARDYMGNLRLYNKKGDVDYLSFIPLGGTSGVAYTVREVHAKDPKMTFYEIIADKGAHGQDAGYWLIGKADGKWVTYISTESIVNMGYDPNVWHHTSSEIEDDGHLYIKSVNGEKKLDVAVSAFWDRNAKWFGLENVTDKFKVSEPIGNDVWVYASGNTNFYIEADKCYKQMPYRYVYVKKVYYNSVETYRYAIFEMGPDNWMYERVDNGKPKGKGGIRIYPGYPDYALMSKICDWVRYNMG